MNMYVQRTLSGTKHLLPLVTSVIAMWLFCAALNIDDPPQQFIWFLAWYTLSLHGTMYVTPRSRRDPPPFRIRTTLAVCVVGVAAGMYAGLLGMLVAIAFLGCFMAEFIECHMVHDEANDTSLLHDAVFYSAALLITAVAITGLVHFELWFVSVAVAYGMYLFTEAQRSLRKSKDNHTHRRFP